VKSKWIVVTCLLIILLCVTGMQCSTLGAAGPIDHPFPTTKSVIPLRVGSQWVYHYSSVDTFWQSVPVAERRLTLSISGMYKLVSADSLIAITGYEHTDDDARYIYKYEWENLDSGYLVQHEGGGEVEKRGLYIVGEFFRERFVLFEERRLWYMFPAKMDTSWEVALPGGDGISSQISCISNSYIDKSAEYSGWSFSTYASLEGCVLYKQVAGEDVYYHSFHPDVGKISMRHYAGGVLLESYILIECVSEW